MHLPPERADVWSKNVQVVQPRRTTPRPRSSVSARDEQKRMSRAPGLREQIAHAVFACPQPRRATQSSLHISKAMRGKWLGRTLEPLTSSSGISTI
jgi:hypothetical protein